MINPQKIWSSSQLPTLPAVAIKLLDASRNPQADIRVISNLIKSDPAIAAKILKAANSTYFGFSTKLTSIDRAVPLLGANVVTSLALSFSVVEAAMTRGPMAPLYSAYWLQSIVQGAAAETIGGHCESGLACEFFLAGLLMDIGRLAMLKTIPDAYRPVLEPAVQTAPLAVLEQQVFAFDHAQIGAELMRHWSLPESLRIATKLQHASLDEIKQHAQQPDFSLIRAIAVAAAAGEYFCTQHKGQALARLRELTTEFYGLSEEKLQDLLQSVKLRIDQTGDLFSVNTNDISDPSDLMAQASEQLAQIAMQAHATSAHAVAKQKEAEEVSRELQVENEQLRQRSLHDPLTRVYNRQFLDDALNREVQRCCRTAAPLGLIFIDIDKFKLLNDNYGHQFGDLVLKRIAACMQEVMRTSDVVARYGGEEFCIMIHEPTEKGLEKVAERLRARIQDEDIRFGDQRVPVTASFGAAMTVPRRDEFALATKLIAAADEAMYEAKRGGRNCVRLRVDLREADRRLALLVLQKRFSRWLVSSGAVDVATMTQALPQCKHPRRMLGDLAQELGFLNAAQVEQILREQQVCQQRFGEVAVTCGFLTEDQLASLIALQLEDPQDLATVLVTLGVFDARRSGQLLEGYWASSPARLLPA